MMRVGAAVLVELQSSGLLTRLAASRGPAPDAEQTEEGASAEERPERGPNLLATLLREELARDDHPSLVRIGDPDRPLWWLG